MLISLCATCSGAARGQGRTAEVAVGAGSQGVGAKHRAGGGKGAQTSAGDGA